MIALTKWIAAPAIALGLLFAGDASEAKAQYGCYGYGGGGIGISIGSHYGGYRVPSYYGGYRSHYGLGHHRSWYHDTTHLDYHPTQIRRHGNHFHVDPGHYHLHRSGHWHH